MSAAVVADAEDIRWLRMLYKHGDGKAWEPRNLEHPWLGRMIEAGYLKRCTMRCGFEAFDTGVDWTDAGRRAMEQEETNA